MKKGGMGAQFFAVYVASSYVEGNHSAKRALDMIDTVKHDIVGKYRTILCSRQRLRTSGKRIASIRSRR